MYTDKVTGREVKLCAFNKNGINNIYLQKDFFENSK